VLDATYQFQCIDLTQDFDLEDLCMQSISEVLEELDLLRALEVERLQLGAVAAWQGH
jgi:hypothetical protein